MRSVEKSMTLLSRVVLRIARQRFHKRDSGTKMLNASEAKKNHSQTYSWIAIAILDRWLSAWSSCVFLTSRPNNAFSAFVTSIFKNKNRNSSRNIDKPAPLGDPVSPDFNYPSQQIVALDVSDVTVTTCSRGLAVQVRVRGRCLLAK